MGADELTVLDPSFRLELPAFEGPLDLLLHLIQKHELSILDLPIAFVTTKYTDYLATMERLNLDIASEYLVMAATLAHIKSKTLLPPNPADVDDDGSLEEIDPRADLIRRLLEYQKYKVASEQLAAHEVAGRDVFLRGTPAPEAEGPAPLAEVSIFKLLDAFQAVLQRANVELAFEVTAERVTIQERITQILETITVRRNVVFEELFAKDVTSYDIVVTFLAILEMAKLHMMRLYQADAAAPIYVEARVSQQDETEGRDEEPNA